MSNMPNFAWDKSMPNGEMFHARGDTFDEFVENRQLMKDFIEASPDHAAEELAPTIGPAPMCPIHTTRPMARRDGSRGPFYSCSFKTGENDWCNKTVNI